MRIVVAVLIVIAVLAASVFLLGVVERPSPAPTPTPAPTTIVPPTPTPILPAPSPTTKPVVTLTAEELVIRAKAGGIKVGDTVRVSGVIRSNGLRSDTMEVADPDRAVILYRGMFALAPAGTKILMEGKITSVGTFIELTDCVKIRDL